MPRLNLRSPYALMLLAVVCFAVLTALTTAQWTAALDRAVLEALRDDSIDIRDRGPSWLMEFMRDLTALAGVGIVVLAAVLVVVYQLLGGAWRAALVTFTVIGGTQLCTSWLKNYISRPRPDLVEHGVNVYTQSYPSGHAGMAAAVGLSLVWYAAGRQSDRRQRIYCWVVGIGAIALIGFTRMYLGVHWLSDVSAGWCLGTFWAAAGRALAQRLGCCGARRLDPA